MLVFADLLILLPNLFAEPHGEKPPDLFVLLFLCILLFVRLCFFTIYNRIDNIFIRFKTYYYFLINPSYDKISIYFTILFW